MLSVEDNKLLTETDKGKPMGELFRRYWIPALSSAELPRPDCPPVRVKLLGEYLIAFRQTNGEIGLVEEYCPHRKASLYFGRNEENGIRCAFHGWKFDHTGKCVDMPSEPPGSKLINKACLTSYPCKEYGGIIWTYMGPKDEIPEFPEFEWGNYSSAHRVVTKFIQRCNYVQGIEANMDSAHLSFLHRGVIGRLTGDHSNPLNAQMDTVVNPKIETKRTPYGLLIGAAREREDGNTYWRVSHFIAPCITLIPRREGAPGHAQAWVPMDDLNCYSFAITWHPDRPLNDEELYSIKAGHTIHPIMNPGSLIPALNIENDYMINRELQASGASFSGVSTTAAQDACVIESTRGIPDRTTEILGTSDIAIIQMRRLLMENARKLRDGQEILKLNGKRINRLRARDGVLPTGVAFEEGLKDKLEV